MFGIGIGVGIGRQRFGGFDADYQAVLNYATTQGYTLPSAAQQVKQNKLVVDLKAAGVWSKLDTFAMFANDGGSNFALIDWKRLSLYTAVNSPTFTTNQGFTGNGTSSYIDTNFNPATSGTNYVLNDASRYYMHFLGTGGIVDGVDLAGAIQALTLGNSAAQRINSTNALNSAFVYSTTKGVKSIHRTSSTDVSLYNDKVGATRTETSTTISSNNQFVLRRFNNYSANQSWGYAMGASLVAENDAFVDALDTYINSL